MNKQMKKLKKEIKRISKRLDMSDGLTLKASCDTKVSLHRNSRDPEPLLTFNHKGEYSTPLIKLILVILLAVTGVSLAVALISKICERLERERLKNYVYDDIPENDDLYTL